MSVRFPLYAKWALGFVLHLALLAAVAMLLLAGRFRDPLARWTLHRSRDRLESAVRLLIGELETRPPYEWDDPIRRFETQYHLPLALLNSEAEALAGSLSDIPETILERLRRPPFPPGARPRRFPPSEPPGEDVLGPPPAPPVTPVGHRLFFRVERAGDPPRYWLITRVRIGAFGDESPRLYLVLSPRRLFGGLFMDPRPLLLGAVALVAISLLLWTPFVQGMTRTIRTLTAAGRRIAAGRFDTRVPARRRDELGELARTLNEMAAQLDAMTRDQKRFLGGIAHELCSPLARMQVALGVLEQRASEGERTYVESALANAQVMSNLVGELLSFSKASFGRSAAARETISVARAARTAAAREAPGRLVRIEAPPGLEVRGCWIGRWAT
jgi:two-component system sensor histidine kinase CpxA